MQGSLRAIGRLTGALLASLFPADCLLCGRILPWRQEGGVCLPCWQDLPWAPGFRPANGPLGALLWAADYEGPAGRLVRALKFEDMDRLAVPLGRETAARLAPLLALLRVDLVVPVPLHWWRHSRRGYNQAALLARALARQAGLPLATGALLRRRAGRRQLGLSRQERGLVVAALLARALARQAGLPLATGALLRRRAGRRQLGLSRQERLASLAGCYAARLSRVHGRTILLVDDVVTTGATLEACARALLRAGAAGVVGCAFARTARIL